MSITMRQCPQTQFVHGELLRISGQCVPADVARFPDLQGRLMGAVESFISGGAVRDSMSRLISDLYLILEMCSHD